MQFVVEPMALEDIDEVIEVEKEAFTTAWSPSAYRREVLENRIARYIVIRELSPALEGKDEDNSDTVQQPSQLKSGIQRIAEGLKRFVSPTRAPDIERRGRIVGFAGMWLMVDEAHLTTIAVRSEYRGHGFGELLLIKAIELAQLLGARMMTLEVRVSNVVAQALYRKYGFQVVGTRRRYYTDNNEDAFIMTVDEITSQQFKAVFEALRDANARRTGTSYP